MQKNKRYLTIVGHEIKLEDAGLVTASVHDDNQPFTVVFVKTKIDFKMKLRTKRQAPVEQTTYDPKDILKHPYESGMLVY